MKNRKLLNTAHSKEAKSYRRVACTPHQQGDSSNTSAGGVTPVTSISRISERAPNTSSVGRTFGAKAPNSTSALETEAGYKVLTSTASMAFQSVRGLSTTGHISAGMSRSPVDDSMTQQYESSPGEYYANAIGHDRALMLQPVWREVVPFKVNTSFQDNIETLLITTRRLVTHFAELAHCTTKPFISGNIA